MNIKDFHSKFSKETQSISKIIEKWNAQEIAIDFLSLSIAPGLVIADMYIGEGTIDIDIPNDVIKACELIMGEKCNSHSEVRDYLTEKILEGNASIRGAISQIQGYVGEFQFQEASNGTIQLAHIKNQDVVDAVQMNDGVKEYIQVKVYKDPNDVIDKMLEANQKIESGSIFWNNPDGTKDLISTPPSFAVNEEIYEKVLQKVSEQGLPNNVINMNISRSDIRDSLTGIKVEIESDFFENFITPNQLLDNIAGPIILATVVQGFFKWYKYRSLDHILITMPKDLAVNSAGVAGAFIGRAGGTVLAEAAILAELEFLAYFVSPVGGIAFAMIARGMTSRISERIDLAEGISKSNTKLAKIIKLAS